MSQIPLQNQVFSQKSSAPGALFTQADSNKDVLNKPDAVLEALISETHHAANRTAILVSWTNALETPETALNAPTVMALLPNDPAIMTTMGRWIRSSTPLSVDTLHHTQEFFWTLNAARKSFNLFMNEANQIGLVRAGILHRTLLTTSWLIAIERALDALNTQAAQAELNLPDIYQQNAEALLGLLLQAKAGGSPCLNSDGSIRLPDLPNQRRNARRYLLENCIVKTQRQTSTAFARDVSMGGMGLDRVPHLSPGKQVMIKLPTGRLFSGRVQWYKNASAGIEFDTQLSPSDPLLSY